MPGFDMIQPSVEALITKEFKKYNDEDMIWMYQEVIHLIKTEHLLRTIRSNNQNHRSIPTFKEFEKIGSFNEIKKYLVKELERINDLTLLESFFLNLKEKNHINNRDNFSFLKENERLCFFTINYIENIEVYRRNSRLRFSYFEKPYLYIVYYYNFHRYENIISDLKRIKALNLDIIKKNYHNNSKNFENKEFLEWSYSYIRDKNKDFSKVRYKPSTTEDYYNLVISFLDYLLYFNKDSHYSLTNQLYKAWSQRKFRAADKVKKPYHLPLTKTAKTELKNLSEFKDKTESEILEELIHQMYLTEMCDDDGNKIY